CDGNRGGLARKTASLPPRAGLKVVCLAHYFANSRLYRTTKTCDLKPVTQYLSGHFRARFINWHYKTYSGFLIVSRSSATMTTSTSAPSLSPTVPPSAFFMVFSIRISREMIGALRQEERPHTSCTSAQHQTKLPSCCFRAAVQRVSPKSRFSQLPD